MRHRGAVLGSDPGAGGTGNQLNWVEREASPHPRDGVHREDPGDAGLEGSGLARFHMPGLLCSPVPPLVAEGTHPFGLPSALGSVCSL